MLTSRYKESLLIDLPL